MSNPTETTVREPVGSGELLPCPFCGGQAESDTMQGFRRMKDGRMGNAVAIYCTQCTVQMTMCHEDFPEYTPDDCLGIMKDAWNIRQGNTEIADRESESGSRSSTG